MHTLTAIEDAVVARLAPLKSTHGLRTLGAYAGELTPRELDRVTPHFPAVWVVVTDIDYEDLGMMTMQVVQFGLLIAHRSLRSDAEAKSGAYPLLEAARTTLLGATLLPGLTPVLIRYETVEMQTRGVCVYSALYSVSQKVNYNT